MRYHKSWPSTAFISNRLLGRRQRDQTDEWVASRGTKPMKKGGQYRQLGGADSQEPSELDQLVGPRRDFSLVEPQVLARTASYSLLAA